MTVFARLANRARFVLYGVYARLFRCRTIYTNSGQQFRITTGTEHETFRAFTFFTKEPETLAWIDAFAADSVLFDVGANIGIYSLYTAATKTRARVFSFEPDSQSFASLCKNIAINGFENVTPFPFALSNEVCLGSLHVSTLAAGAGAAALGEDYSHMNIHGRDVARQGVFVASLDHLVFELDLPFPHYIKIDVDGIEKKILEGGRRVLRDGRLKGLLVELQYETDHDIAELHRSLRSGGMEMIATSKWEATYRSGLRSRNFIFGRAELSNRER